MEENIIIAKLHDQNKSLRLNELAVIIDVSRRSLQRMVKANQIPHFRVRHIVRFDPKQIAAWYEDHENGRVDRVHVGREKSASLGRSRKKVSAGADSLQQAAN